MTLALDQLATLGQLWLIQGFLVFLRIGAATALLPAFGEQTISVRIRLFVALAFTAIVTPAVAADLPADMSANLIVSILAETVSGLAIGIGLRLFLTILQIAGTMMAQATSLSQVFGGAGADPQPAIAQLLQVAGLALAVQADLHLRLAELFILSYQILPAGRFPAPQDLSQWGIGQVARGFGFAFTLAAPFTLASLIYNVALGAINRAMPQLMVAFVGAPALTFGGLALLMVTAPLALALWHHAWLAYLAAPFTPVP